MANTPVLGIYQ